MDPKLRNHVLILITNKLSSFQHQAATTSRVPANRNWATHRFLGGSSASGCYVEKSTHLSSAGEDAQKCPPSPSPPRTSPFPRLTLCKVERRRGSADCATLPPSRPPANWWRRPAGPTNRFPTPATCLLLLFYLLLLLFLLLYSLQC